MKLSKSLNFLGSIFFVTLSIQSYSQALLPPLGAGGTTYASSGAVDSRFGPYVSYAKLNVSGNSGSTQTALEVTGSVPSGAANQFSTLSYLGYNITGSATGGTLVSVGGFAKNGKSGTYGLDGFAELNLSGANSSSIVCGTRGQAKSNQAGDVIMGLRGYTELQAGASFSKAFGVDASLSMVNSNATQAFGGRFVTTGGNVDASFGLYGHVNGGVSADDIYGTYGRVTGSSAAISAYGSYGLVDNTSSGTYSSAYGGYGGCAQGTVRYGLFGVATNGGAFTTLYGLFGRAPILQSGSNSSAWTSYAGYFDGHVFVTGSFFAVSDFRLKKNIKPLNGSLDLIRKLQPKEYEFNHSACPSMNLPHEKQFGLIAQEVERVAPNMVGQGSHPAQNDADGNVVSEAYNYKAVNYLNLVPLLIAGVKEQQDLIESQTRRIDELTEIVEELKMLVGMQSGSGTLTSEKFSLEQNTPNPFREMTVVEYELPRGDGPGTLQIFDSTGRMVEQVGNLAQGKGRVKIDGDSLRPGTYTYTIAVNGQVLGGRTMVVEE
jgi:hypothetical protein